MNNTTSYVYLAGTVSPDPKHINWRTDATEKLWKNGIHSLNPLRGADPTCWDNSGYETITAMTCSGGGFVHRDEMDIKHSDAILLYFMESLLRQSIGTWTEFGWATALHKPVIVVSTLPEVVEHPFVWKKAARLCATLDESIEYLKYMFCK